MVNTSDFSSLLFDEWKKIGQVIYTSSIQWITLEILTREYQECTMCTHVHRAFKNYFTKVILKRSCPHLKMLNAQKKKRKRKKNRFKPSIFMLPCETKYTKEDRLALPPFLAPFNLSTSRNKWKWSSVNRARGLSTRQLRHDSSFDTWSGHEGI